MRGPPSLPPQVDLKIVIGLLGVLIVLMAVIGSICLLNLARIDATLIIIEVVPFLVLAVGVDNLFIIVHSFEVSYTHTHTPINLPPTTHVLSGCTNLCCDLYQSDYQRVGLYCGR